MVDYERIANQMIDDYCDLNGARAAIQYLSDIGCSKDDLVEMKFDKTEVEQVLSLN